MTDTTDPLGLACEHGMLARACEVCEQGESEHAALLRDLDSATAGIQRLDRLDAESAAKAIRALKAELAFYQKAHGTDGESAYWQEIAKVVADRDRLAGEVERIRVQFDEAIARIKDMLEEDDGQAFKEAGKFLLRIKGRDDES